MRMAGSRAQRITGAVLSKDHVPTNQTQPAKVGPNQEGDIDGKLHMQILRKAHPGQREALGNDFPTLRTLL